MREDQGELFDGPPAPRHEGAAVSSPPSKSEGERRPRAAEPTATILAFPLDRWVGKARAVAATWLRYRSQSARDRYWKSQTDGIVRAMRRAGFGDDEIRRQLEGLATLVRPLVQTDRPAPRSDSGPGAA